MRVEGVMTHEKEIGISARQPTPNPEAVLL
jgi:hypothetical protein